MRDASLLKASAHIREKKVDLPLWDANGKKLWECLGNEIDVAALKIPEDLLGKLWWYTAEASFKEGDILNTAEIPLGLPVLALGYPLGFCDKDNYYPIVRGATVATLPSWGFKREQCFLIDGRLHPGMSGSPVISSPITIRSSGGSQDTETLERDQDVCLLGVFSDEWGMNGEQLGLNTVWPAYLITHVIKKLVCSE